MSQFEDRGFQGAGLGLAMVLGSTLVSGALAGAREAGEQAADSFTAYQWSLACEALEAKAAFFMDRAEKLQDERDAAREEIVLLKCRRAA